MVASKFCQWFRDLLRIVGLNFFSKHPLHRYQKCRENPQLYDGSNSRLIHEDVVCHKDIFFYEFQSNKKAKLYQHRPQIAYHLHATSPGYYGSRELEDKHPKFPTIIPVSRNVLSGNRFFLPSSWGQIDEKGAECWCTDSVVPIDLVS